jgi:hypothetical protein
LALAATLLAAGCGGTRQDASEPSRRFAVVVVHASFPKVQVIARRTLLTIAVHNLSAVTAPNVAVTLDSLTYRLRFPGLSDPRRPIWVVERGPGVVARPPVESQEISKPGSGQTAYVQTWALGPLAPGSTRVFNWVLVPVRSGLQTVHYTVSPGLAGKARPLVPRLVRGQLNALVAGKPPPTYVDPTTGKVVVGLGPSTP